MASKPIPKAIATLNSGEQDPALLGRWDTEQFFKGAAKLRNCYSLVTGGVVRRPGLERIGDVHPAPPTADFHARFIPYVDGKVDFATGKASGALIVIGFEQITVWDVPGYTLLQTIVDSTYNLRQDDITWTQSGDDIIIFHPAKQPRRLSIATGTWTLTTLSFESIPQFAFDDTVGVATSQVTNVKYINMVSSDRTTYFVDGVETGWIINDPASMSPNMETNIKDAIEALPGVTVGDVTVTHKGGATFSGANFDITFAGTVDGRRFIVTPGQIDEQNVATLDGVLFFREETRGRKAEEDVWSGTLGTGDSLDRGWPRCGAFFGNRLFMAGSPALGNAAWGSRINNAEDFIVLDDPTDDSPILYFTDTEQGAEFNQVFVGRHLQFFSSNTEFWEPNSDKVALTPTNFTLRAATSVGAMRGAPILFLEGSSIYLQRDGRALRRYIFDESEQNYRSPSVSVRGGHLLNPGTNFFSTPTGLLIHDLPIREIALQRSRDTENPDRIFIINEAANLICITVNEDERVLAWHQWETDGKFANIAVVGDDIFVGVFRGDDLTHQDDNDMYFIERFDSRLLVDAATFDFSITPPIAASTDMEYLEAAVVSINTVEKIVDGISQGTQDFTPTVTIATFDPAALTDWQVGVPFPDVKGDGSQVWIKTLPVEIEELKRILAGDRKRVVSVILRLLDTGSIRIQGEDVPLLEWIEAGDMSLHRQTGDFEKAGLDQVNKFGQIDITQSKSDHMHLLALKLKVLLLEE